METAIFNAEVEGVVVSSFMETNQEQDKRTQTIAWHVLDVLLCFAASDDRRRAKTAQVKINRQQLVRKRKGGGRGRGKEGR